MKMGETMKKMKILLLMAAFAMMAQSVSALTVLPDSDLYDGKMVYSNITLEFAVYDSTTAIGQAFEIDFGIAPGVGQYIYAYQVFTTFEIDFFAVYDTEGTSWSDGGSDDNIGALDDQYGGIEPTDARFGESSSGLGTLGIWDFQPGTLVDGKQSWLMVIRSDNTFKKTGNFTVEPLDQGGLPIPPIPEPATLMLFAGVAAILRHAKKKGRIQA